MEQESYDVLIGAADLEKEKVMNRHRLMLDAGAKSARSRATFDREEIIPYRIEVENPQTKERSFLPETDETRQYRVLRRFYK